MLTMRAGGGSLRTKLYKIIVPTMVIIMLSVIVGFNYKTFTQINLDFESYKHATVAQQAELLEDVVKFDNQESSSKYLRSLVGNENIVGAYVTLAGDRPVFSSGVPYHVANQYDILSKNFKLKDSQGNLVPAKLRIAFTDLYIKGRFTERVIFEVAMVLLAILIIVLSVLLFNRVNIEAPIERLLKAIQVGRDSPDALVKDYCDDELGAVTKAFNEMRQRDWEQSDALEQAKNSLELRVKERTRDLEKAYKDLKQASLAKDEFLATMSHEIRTPMNGIIGLTELLLESGLPDYANQYASMVHSSAKTLLAIINDILDLSKLENGQYQLQKEAFDLRAGFEEVMILFKREAQLKSIHLRLEVDDEIEQTVVSDANRIKQILINLISNALKFTEEGQIVVKVSKDPQHPSSLLVRVIDSGIGIDKSDQSKLFKKFSQVDASHARKYGGAGLGLAISKQLVLALGGKIGVDSCLDKGSTFWFSFPVSAAASVENDAPSSFVPGKVLNILIVEDNAVNQMVIKGLLSKAGYKPDVVETGEQALAAITLKSYDVVLMDIQLPGMDGLETAQAIRELKGEVRHTPIIALTANAMVGHREAYLAKGMDEYVPKPIERYQLFQAIAKVTQAPNVH